MSVTFQEERFADVIGEAASLTQRHWEEIARNRDSIPLAPDMVRYSKMDEMGLLLICTARLDGKLVGYAAYFLEPHGHINYRKTPWSHSNIFWVDNGLREHGIGSGLFRFVEMALKSHGIAMMHTRTKIAHPAAGKMLQSLGQAAIETVFEKVLS